jgi:hypothetical protein
MMLIKEKFELDEHIEVPDNLIPSASEGKTNLLHSKTILKQILKATGMMSKRNMKRIKV